METKSEFVLELVREPPSQMQLEVLLAISEGKLLSPLDWAEVIAHSAALQCNLWDLF
jgi:hypothetical protein